MKIILTTCEILQKLGLPTDAELVIELGQVQDSDSGEWISNVGRDNYAYPDSLSSDTEIEVKYRNGNTDTGRARNWFASWKEVDGTGLDIVAYRILTS